MFLEELIVVTNRNRCYDGNNMPTQLLTTHKKTLKIRLQTLEEHNDEAWENIRGLWKKKRVNAVRYQKKIRKEADRHGV